LSTKKQGRDEAEVFGILKRRKGGANEGNCR
jgi:hypothetical protein